MAVAGAFLGGVNKFQTLFSTPFGIEGMKKYGVS
jgi:hypothetical protein